MRRALILVAACALAASAIAAQPVSVTAAPPRPNIVIFYLDDVAPHDGRLWNDPDRTPAIYDTFVAHGIHFDNAFGENPLCCPARAGLLTGLHTHNNGVNVNDARLFSPQETVAGALRDVGYTTMWIGKYLNHDNSLSRAGWAAHMAPWSVFDGIFGVNGKFYDYVVRTKDAGDVHYGDVHSTQMVTDRTVMRMRAAPPDKPIFALLSVFNLHAPNIPLPVDPALLAKCDSMPPWWTPAYNEADVSDKPSFIRALPLLPYSDGWPMDGYCREMFGVDRLVKQVTDELDAEGRLDNTLLVFTADNGMTWGAHRKTQSKTVPYATPLPLYMAWPHGWGSTPREVTDYVSNIDLAPTFCALGGCTLGPYASGQTGPDGQSLAALLDHGTPLDRDALLESSPAGNSYLGIPGWAALRTTTENLLGRWHYIEYADGERELYDSVHDPYELENLANDPGHTAIEAFFAWRLADLLNEGRVNRPDLSLWGKAQNLYTGYNLFASVATPAQTLTINVRRGQTYRFQVDLRNNKLATDSFLVAALQSDNRVRLAWLLDGVDVTAQMATNGVRFLSLPGVTTRSLVLRVTVKLRFPRGHRTAIDIDAQSSSSPGQDDHVVLVVRR